MATAGADALAHDSRARVAPQVYHLGARIGLLKIIGHGHAVELANAAVTLEDTAGILPCDGTAGLHLRPRNLRVVAAAQPALSHQVVHATTSLAVARVPVLHRRVLDLGTLLGHNFDYGRVQLIFVTHRRRTALKVAHIRIVIGHNKRALKLARTGRIDAEIRRQLHRAAHPLGDVHKRPI